MITNNERLMNGWFKYHLSQNSELYILVIEILKKNNFNENQIKKLTNDFLEHEKKMTETFEEIGSKFTLYITNELLPKNIWSMIHEDFFKNEEKRKNISKKILNLLS